MKKRLGFGALSMIVAVAALAGGRRARAADDAAKSPPPLAQQEAQLKAVAPSLVIVEYTLQYDKGEAPQGRYDVEDLVKDERPLEQPGFLVDATHIVTEDMQIHPRFVKSIAVRGWTSDAKTGKRVAATLWGYPKNHNLVLLEMAAALPGTTPAAFDAKRPGPLSVISPTELDGRWSAKVAALGGDLVVEDNGKKQLSAADAGGLVVDAAGEAVGVKAWGRMLPADESWKGDPMKWPMVSAADMKKDLAAINEKAAKGIVRVMLNFRSPKVTQSDQYGDQADNATLAYELGVLLDDHTVLVLADLKPTVTARLQRIKLFTNPPVEAKFKASLADYGAFLATLDKPAAGAAMPLSTASIGALQGTILPTERIYLQGDTRISYVQPRRILGFALGWRRNEYPEIGGRTQGLFVFDPEGALLALPIAHREKIATEDQYGGRNGAPVTSFAQLNIALSDLKTHADPGNVPLTEDQENRLAWLGFDLQPMSSDLAQADHVSDQTNDGQTGALVNYVYPDSPAGKAGVQPGWVLLRIDAPDQPKPIDVRVQNDPYADQPFPWDQLGGASEQYFDRIFTLSPWPRAENTVVREVTDLGFGKKFSMEFFHDGKVDKKQFTVVEGPPHFDNAPKYNDVAMGLTVKDLTYEVRRYMQKKPDDPGVIVGKIEKGGKASKAGIKPFEVITHVNDHPVMNVKDFEKFTKGQNEVRLSVKRMTQGRIVKITQSDAAGAATRPADKTPGAKPAAGVESNGGAAAAPDAGTKSPPQP